MKVQPLLQVAAALCLSSNACLLPEEIEAERHLEKYGRYPKVSTLALRARKNEPNPIPTGVPIGNGHRFRNARSPPRGLGTEERGMGRILTPEEVTYGLRALANYYKDVGFFDASHRTEEGRTVSGIQIGTGEPRIYIQGGIHARERGAPDHILYFLSDLLHAHEHGTGIKYGSKSYTNEQVVTALSAGIVTMPMVNPDGVAYDQETGSCWRKNRSRKSAQGELAIGVDVNRNFDAVWDFKKYFNDTIHPPASDIPSSDNFHGLAPFSEPESQNAAWIAEQHTGLSWFLDLHSFAGDVLYAWGDDNPQTTDPTQNFKNAEWDGKRGVTGDGAGGRVYKEYVEAADLQAQLDAATRMSKAMNDAGDGATVEFKPVQEAGLYASSGGSTDYFLGRYYGHTCGASRINGLAIEFGADSGLHCPFYPTESQYHNSMRQVGAGLMELVLTTAGEDGNLKTWECSKGK